MGHTKHIVMSLFILNFLMVTCPVIGWVDLRVEC
jgi:hypothetical protein